MKNYELAIKCKEVYDHDTKEFHEVEYSIDHDQGVIAFAGTQIQEVWKSDNWMDIIRDIRITPWYDRRTGWMHAGFLKGARAALEEMDLDITKYWTLTGHSLGGALALAAGKILNHEGYDLQVVGFGAPRAFIGKRRLKFNVKMFRYGADPIPLVPKVWMGGYMHPTMFYQINPISIPSYGTMYEIKHEKMNRKRLEVDFNDHRIERYINSLERLER